MTTLFIVLGFPLILVTGYGLAYTLSRGNRGLLVGPAGFVLYLCLLTIPLVAVLAGPGLPSRVMIWHSWTPAWIAAGLVAGVGLWGVQVALPGSSSAGANKAESRVWVGPPGMGWL